MKKYLIFCSAIIIANIILFSAFSFKENNMQINQALINTEEIFHFVVNQYIRNKDEFPTEEYKQNIISNGYMIGQLSRQNQSKMFVSKYKKNVLSDCDYFFQVIFHEMGTPARNKLAYDSIEKISKEIRKITSNKKGIFDTLNISQEGYEEIHNIILEYENTVKKLPKE